MKIIEKFKDKINGVLSAFDRMIIKGHILQFFGDSGRRYFLSQENVLLKDFGDYAEKITKTIKASIEETTEKTGRPLIYLNSSKTSKEGTAQNILKEDPIKEGLICVISTLETSPSLEIRKNKETQKLELKNGQRKCLHYYFYYLDKEFGFMHVKLQSWFPFGIQVYVNGREYISKQLDKEGIVYKRYDNCFVQIDNIEKAQEISNDFGCKKLDGMLEYFAKQINPFTTRIKEIFNHDYFWCMDQCEYATDVMFKSRKDLESVYYDFVHHGIVNFKFDDVMTFMGRKMHSAFSGEIVSDIKIRPCGIRIKHRMKQNSIKMYDKYSVLRVETTINNPREFKVFKKSSVEGKPDKWVPMGKSISNLYRYAEVSKSANHKYLDAMALADVKGECIDEIEKLCTKIEKGNRTYTGLNPLSKETELLFGAVFNGGNHINGFTNASIRKALYPDASDNDKKIRNKVTRLLSKLRAFGLISKIPRSFRYKITTKGIRIISATLSIKNTVLPSASKAA
ncbi:TPA: hypothetical protein ENS27_11235 [bacterium]|nr:hypothetical protein [bacterium]